MSEIIRTAEMIAGEINGIKAQVRTTAAIASVEIGRKLKEAKGLVPEGMWSAWLEDNVAYSLRTAQNLMALATEWDAGRGAGLENMSYSKAVLLLSVPAAERKQFIAEHNAEGMSVRELKKAIADDVLDEGEQLDMARMIAEEEQEEKAKQQEQIDELKRRVQELQTEAQVADAARGEAAARQHIAENQAKKSAEDAAALEKKIKSHEKANAEAVEKMRKAEEKAEKAEARAKELAERIKAQPAPEVRYETPEEVEKELEQLRKQAARSTEEAEVRAAYTMLKSAHEALMDKLSELEKADAELAGRFRAAFAKALSLMSEEVAG